MVVEKGYKQTEIGILPVDWKLLPIDEIFSFFSTSNYSKAQMTLEGEVGCIHYGLIHAISNCEYNIKNGIKYYVTKEQANYEFIKNGDVIMVDASEDLVGVNKSIEIDGIVDVKYIAGLHTFLLRDTESKLFKGYRGAILNSTPIRNQFLRLAVGMKVFGVSKPQLKTVLIPVPPLPEQTAIATALSDMDALIAQTEKLIEKKKAIKHGVMQELLRPKEGWVTKKLGEVCEIEKGAQINRSTLDISGEFPVYNGGIAPSGYTSSFNTLENTIIISEGGNSCGYVNYIKSKFWRGGHCYEIRPNNYLNKHFAYFLLKHNEAEIMALRVGSGLPNIQRSSLAKFEIKFPDSNEQALISNILIDLQDSFDLLIAKLQKLKHQKQGMMQALLTGKIRLV